MIGVPPVAVTGGQKESTVQGGAGGLITSNTLTGVNVIMCSASGEKGGVDIEPNNFQASGAGASGNYGIGGSAVRATANEALAGVNARGYGAGGSGASARSSSTSNNAIPGAGAKGFALFEWIY